MSWDLKDTDRGESQLALAVAEAGDGAVCGELAARVVGGHRGAVPSPRLLQFDQPGAGHCERLRRADPQTVAGHAPVDPGVGRARLDDRPCGARRDRRGLDVIAPADAAEQRPVMDARVARRSCVS